MLYLIGLGIDERDITLKAVDAIKKCKIVYLERYTSIGSDVGRIVNKNIIEIDRDFLEDGKEILERAKTDDVAVLIYGDVLFATTHISLVLDAEKQNIKVEIIHGISVFNYLGDIGLIMYNFGKTASISFNESNVPFQILEQNLKLGMHTLILLDLDPKNNKFFSINNALEYLIQKGMENRLVIACCRLGCKDAFIKAGKAKELLKIDFRNYPQCLIIPGDLHFIEEDALERWKI